MFQKEIQFITDFNLNKIRTLGKSFTLNSLFNADLHPALIKYISGRLDFMIYEERKILLENSMFDYSGARIAEYFKLISEEIKKTKKLSFTEAEELVKKGVVFNANLSVQPKYTLTSLIYKDSISSRSSTEIKIYLDYLYYYEYYREIIFSYLTKRKIVNLTKEEFEKILDKIDSQVLSSGKEEVFSDALNSISDFYNDGGISKASLQPALVEAYLKEKGLNEEIKNLQKEIGDRKNKIDIAELKRILLSAPLKEEEASEEKAVDENDDASQTLPEIRYEEEIEKEIKAEDDNLKSEELKKEAENYIEKKNEQEKIEEEENRKLKEKELKYDRNITPEPDDPLIDEDENEKTDTILEEEIVDINNQSYDSEIEEIIEEEIPGLKRSKREKDIFSYLTQKEIDNIVSSIFNEDGDDFANTLEKISECKSYEESAEILKSVFFTYRINPYKREAVSLTNAVSNYFNQGK